MFNSILDGFWDMFNSILSGFCLEFLIAFGLVLLVYVQQYSECICWEVFNSILISFVGIYSTVFWVDLLGYSEWFCWDTFNGLYLLVRFHRILRCLVWISLTVFWVILLRSINAFFTTIKDFVTAIWAHLTVVLIASFRYQLQVFCL